MKVAKHGNRAMSSRSGSADVLEALGVKIDLTAAQVETCLREAGIGFMYAPAFHPSMKYASAPRREIGIRTVFNILGPLTNPAGAQAQVVGIPGEEFGYKMARALGILGTKHAILVHGLDGIDEISITGRSRIWEVGHEAVVDYYLSPGDFGFKAAQRGAIQGGSPAENAATLRSVLGGERGPRRDVTVMNAAAAIMAAREIESSSGIGGVSAIVDCTKEAQDSIDSGRAMEKLEALIRITSAFGADH
jgi:anthranilate phosphoribosyltransferase